MTGIGTDSKLYKSERLGVVVALPRLRLPVLFLIIATSPGDSDPDSPLLVLTRCHDFCRLRLRLRNPDTIDSNQSLYGIGTDRVNTYMWENKFNN